MEELIVTRDGTMDASYVRKARLNAFKAETAHVAVFLAKTAQKGLKELVTPILLDIHDAQHSTNLRHEYFARKHGTANAQMRQLVGLN